MSKTRLKMLCHVVLISITDCITEMISTQCGMSGNLSDEISWFLSPLSLSQFYKPDLKNNLSQIYYQKEKIFINKVFQKNTISSTGFP